tara:strand:- start:751 stop:3198 length:2448 start_codon:yes stop_codon:yes gene_type:complete
MFAIEGLMHKNQLSKLSYKKMNLLPRFLFVFLFILGSAPAQICPCENPLMGWSSQKAYSIDNTTNPNILSDYQVAITIDTESLINQGLMNSDGSDIRVSGDCENLDPLSFWYDGINTSETKLWVKIPMISANTTKIVYVHYGNPSAASISDGSEVFIAFDDFESTNPDWTFQGGTWENESYLGENVLKSSNLTYGAGHVALLNSELGHTDYIVEVKYLSGIDNVYGGPLYEYDDGNNFNSYHLMTDIDVTMISLITNGSPYYGQMQPFSSEPNNWYNWKIERIGSLNTINIYLDNIFQVANPTVFSDGLGLWNFGNSSGSVYYDNLFVRKYSESEPTISELIFDENLCPITEIEINGSSGFRMFSSPTSGTLYSDLLEELWTQGSVGSDMPGGYDNVWTYNNGGWQPIEDLNNEVLDEGQGVLVYVFSDTDFDGEDDLPVTIGVDGDLNESEISITTNVNEWNLLGNPYGYFLDVEELVNDNSNFNSTVYVWDNESSAYKVHNGIVGDLEEGLIAPFSGFWIEAGGSGTEFNFTNNSISGSSTTAGRTTTDNSQTGSAVFTFSSEDYISSVYVSFTPDGDINLESADASRLVPMSPVEHLTSMIFNSSKSLSINNLPSISETDISYDLDVMLLNPTDDGFETQAAQVSMAWDISKLPEGILLSLQNNFTGEVIDLNSNTPINFYTPSKGEFSLEGGFLGTYPEVGESQFSLSVHYSTMASPEDLNTQPEAFELHSAYPNPFNPSTSISYELSIPSHISLDIYDLNGRHVQELVNKHMNVGRHEVVWNANQFASGVYIVKLATAGKIFNQKITYIK